jgi:hypothetical protein
MIRWTAQRILIAAQVPHDPVQVDRGCSLSRCAPSFLPEMVTESHGEAIDDD